MKLSPWLLGLAVGASALLSIPSADAIEYPEIIEQSTTRNNPYEYIGRVSFKSGRFGYFGSGTVVTPFGVLTAAHNLYDRRSGFSTNIRFERGKYRSDVIQTTRPSSLAVLSGYQNAVKIYGGSSSRGFALDMGSLSFTSAPGAGGNALYTSDTSLLRSSSFLKIAIGYGGEFHSGNVPLAVQSFRACTVLRTGYFGNRGFYVESGMSGGPVFIYFSNGSFRVAAVVVSGSKFDSGIRVIDSDADNFIKTQLR